jgi:DNA-binding LacI/PurR family transcriptional regulator
MDTMGEIAASWILEAIEAGEKSESSTVSKPRLRLLSPVLIERESTARNKKVR